MKTMKMFGCNNSKMPSLAASGLVAKIFMRFLFVLIATAGHLAVNAQKSTGTFIFSLLNSGHRIRQRPSLPETTASVFYGTDTLIGTAKLTGGEVVFTPQHDPAQRKFNVSEERLKGVQFHFGTSTVSFLKKEGKGKLLRLLFDAYGLKIYDDALHVAIEPGNIQYDELLFEYEGKLYPAVTFWTTSTKKSIMKILNEIFGLSLRPKDFKNKEAVMTAVLSYDDRIFSSKK